ncbi:hypothetical protein PILCRDRAFT_816476 [Piloderma croceum F 1598]|uniref:Uncharacterized protein n=1 Tax=Piloderma croceum (strain F 1598) TaxID=765440 RepID=A0A0C3C880_PILCF|nr:hypothetical protein PILCRDRAFT_816476 [Piloderma croceum F 1598]
MGFVFRYVSVVLVSLLDIMKAFYLSSILFWGPSEPLLPNAEMQTTLPLYPFLAKFK